MVKRIPDRIPFRRLVQSSASTQQPYGRPVEEMFSLSAKERIFSSRSSPKPRIVSCCINRLRVTHFMTHRTSFYERPMDQVIGDLLSLALVNGRERFLEARVDGPGRGVFSMELSGR